VTKKGFFVVQVWSEFEDPFFQFFFGSDEVGGGGAVSNVDDANDGRDAAGGVEVDKVSVVTGDGACASFGGGGCALVAIPSAAFVGCRSTVNFCSDSGSCASTRKGFVAILRLDGVQAVEELEALATHGPIVRFEGSYVVVEFGWRSEVGVGYDQCNFVGGGRCRLHGCYCGIASILRPG